MSLFNIKNSLFVCSFMITLSGLYAQSNEVQADYETKSYYLNKTHTAIRENPDSVAFYGAKYIETRDKLGLFDELNSTLYGSYVQLPTSFYYNFIKEKLTTNPELATDKPLPPRKEYDIAVAESLKVPISSIRNLAASRNSLLSQNFKSLAYYFSIYQNKYLPDSLDSQLTGFYNYLQGAEFGPYDYFPFYVGAILHEYGDLADKKLLHNILEQGVTSTERYLETGTLSAGNELLHRFLLGQLYHLKAKEAEKENRLTDALRYYKLAAAGTTTATMSLLNSEYGSVLTSYLNFFSENDFELPLMDRLALIDKISAEKSAKLETLTELSRLKPTKWKNALREFYTQEYAGDFNTYWLSNIIPEGTATDVDESYLATLLKGFDIGDDDFVLLDFWGTWCGVCISEMHLLEKTHQQSSSIPNFKVISIACHDTKEKVDGFMQEHNYSFPVVVSDGSHEKNFKITGYPSKLLISPSRKVTEIPGLGDDFYAFVSAYFEE